MKSILIDSRLLDNKCENRFSSFIELSKYNIPIYIKGDIKDEAMKSFIEEEKIDVRTIDSEISYIKYEKDTELKLIDYIYFKKGDKISNILELLKIIKRSYRKASINRKTNETDIIGEISLDGSGKSNIKTGIGFFDHMLQQIVKHSNIDLILLCNGDLDVDEHHTVEDCGIVLGQLIKEALGDKKGITRYGYYLPMDDSVARCAIDLGGRSYLNFKCKFKRETVGELPTELVEEFFRAVAFSMNANLYLKVKGKNEHHKIEALFKAFAKALNMAFGFEERNYGNIPSTKGAL